MADVRFTAEQQQAIDTIDKSLLVSAAAGSGKTAVLVERIISIILRGEANVDEMLVVTFTNAAAKEMKQKLTKAIKQHIKDHPETAATLREQLNRMYRVYIQTFNSFAYRIVKEFFYEIDVEPNVKVCDEVKSTLLMQEAIDDLFDRAFEDDAYINGGSFRDFLRLYSSEKNESMIKQNILETYGKLRSIPCYFDWARKSVEQLKLNAEDFLGTHQGKLLRKYICSDIKIAYNSACRLKALLLEHDLEDFFIKGTDKTRSLESEFCMIEELFEISKSNASTRDIIDSLFNISFDRMPSATKDQKVLYSPIKDEVKQIRDYYKKLLLDWIDKFFAPDFDTMIAEMNETYLYSAYYINILEAFEEIFKSRKNELGVLDFGDMDHNATRILENDEIAGILRNRFKYIFIDEYQDTNNIQEYLINKFARKDNVFKVGDIKQSIYGFREAEPAIFERTRELYSDEDNTEQTVIDLQRNFRSNSRTIDYVNAVFEDIMEGYDEHATLRPGLSFGDDLDEYDFEPEVHLLEKDKDSSVSEFDSGKFDNKSENADNALANNPILTTLTPDEAEATYVARLVKKLIGTDFYDSKQGIVRPVEPGDIAILMNSVKFRGEYYTRALRDLEIDSQIEIEADYFDAIEIRTTLSLLQAIDNVLRDVPLIAVLHSEIYGFGADELALIRVEYKEYCRDNEVDRSQYFYQNIKWYEENGNNEDLRLKLSSAMTKLDYYRQISTMMPLEQFIWEVLLDSEYYMYAGAIQGGDVRQANLRLLVDRAGHFAAENIATLSDFIVYLEEMQNKKISPGQSASSSSSSMVNIMTIHKSKGLEFPFVIVSSLGTKFIQTKRLKGCMLNSEIGLALPYVRNDKKYWKSSLMQNIIAKKLSYENLKERVRVLYVAMTRARNKLYMVGTVDPGFFESCDINDSNMLYLMGHNLKTPFNRLITSTLDQTKESKPRGRIENVLKSRSSIDERSIEEARLKVYERLDYEYPYTDLLNMQAKLSVSTIRREMLAAESINNYGDSNVSTLDIVESGSSTEGIIDDSRNESSIPQSSDEEIYNIWREFEYLKTKASRADIGTAYHRIMEQIDFAKAILDDGTINEDYIASISSMLLKSNAIEHDVYSRLDNSRITTFFRSNLGKRACAAARHGKLYKEKPFTLSMPYNGNNTLVQGVIDCCFFEDGKAVLIDYKSSFIQFNKGIDDEIERIKREYHPQIDIYRQALQEGSGLPVSEAYLYLFVIDRAIKM